MATRKKRKSKNGRRKENKNLDPAFTKEYEEKLHKYGNPVNIQPGDEVQVAFTSEGIEARRPNGRWMPAVTTEVQNFAVFVNVRWNYTYE